MRGNCYVASEALFYILGGKDAGWRVYRAPCRDSITGGPETHWWLEHVNGTRVDPSALQFPPSDLPAIYQAGRRAGFLTREPSKRARALIKQLTWQDRKSKRVEGNLAPAQYIDAPGNEVM